MSKLLTVFGATGQQGGSLINHILNHPTLSKTYKLRGITRDVTKPAAVALNEKGVETVKADMDDKSSLKDAVVGSYGVFAVTNFWEKASADVEIAQGKAMADAAVAAGASFIIWSSLPHISKITGGKLTSVRHFDSKAVVEEYIRTLPIQSTFYMAGFYMQNMLTVLKPTQKPDGSITFSQPWSLKTRLPLIDITNTGVYLAPVLLDPSAYNGTRLTCATAFYTQEEMVDTWTSVTGKKVTFTEALPGGSWGGLSPQMLQVAKDTQGLMREWEYYGPTGPEDLKWMLARVEREEELTSWEEFVRANEPWFEGV